MTTPIVKHEQNEDQKRRSRIRSRIFDLKLRISKLERKLTTKDAGGNEVRIGDVVRMEGDDVHWYKIVDIHPWDETTNLKKLHPGILEGSPAPGTRVIFAGHRWILVRLNEDKTAVLDKPRRLRRRIR